MRPPRGPGPRSWQGMAWIMWCRRYRQSAVGPEISTDRTVMWLEQQEKNHPPNHEIGATYEPLSQMGGLWRCLIHMILVVESDDYQNL